MRTHDHRPESRIHRLSLLTLLLVLLASSAVAAPLAVGRFNAGDLTGWHDKPFKGKTVYGLVKENGRTVLKAHSVKAAPSSVVSVAPPSVAASTPGRCRPRVRSEPTGAVP